MSNWDLKKALDRLKQQNGHFNSGLSYVQLTLDALYNSKWSDEPLIGFFF